MAKNFLGVWLKKCDGHFILHQVLLNMINGFFRIGLRNKKKVQDKTMK